MGWISQALTDNASDIMAGVSILSRDAAVPAVPAPEIAGQAELTLELLPGILEGRGRGLYERWETVGRHYSELDLAMAEIPDTTGILKRATWAVLQREVESGAVDLAGLVDAMMEVEAVLENCRSAMVHSYLGARDIRVAAQAERMQALYTLTEVLSTENDRYEMYRAIVDKVASITGLTRSTLLVYNENGELEPAASNFTDSMEKLKAASTGELSALAAVASPGGPVVLEKGGETPRDIEHLLSHYHTPVLLVVPLKSADRDVGLLLLDRQTAGEFTREQLDLAVACANQAAIALEHGDLVSEMETRLKHMAAIGIVARSLNTYIGPADQLSNILEMACALVRGDSGVILLAEEMFGELNLESRRGDIGWATGPSFQDVARWVFNNHELVLWHNGISDPRFKDLELPVEEFVVAPLMVREKSFGVIGVAASRPGEGYGADDLEMFENFSAQAAVSIENTRLYDRLQDTYLGAIGALAAAIEARDPYTVGHSARVTQYAVAIAQAMGLATDEVEEIRLAGLLHDLGKIGIPDNILNKPGRLSEEEYSAIKMHPALSMRIIEPLPHLGNIIPIIYHHHERFDGHGYMDGKAGETIPLGARIIAVADSYEAMTSDRPYRTALSREEAVVELKRCSGTQFDPVVVRHFMDLLESTVA